ncbi:hypothetical protein ACWDKQ_25885 [Saccharopolyspora sp. NPDC000995]
MISAVPAPVTERAEPPVRMFVRGFAMTAGQRFVLAFTVRGRPDRVGPLGAIGAAGVVLR